MSQEPSQNTSAPHPQATEVASRTQLDEAALDRLRDLDPSGSNQLLPRIVAAYFKSLDKLLPELQAARSAGMDLGPIRHVAHTLKSSSASLGALTLAGYCADIENLVRAGQTEGLDRLLNLFDTEIEQVRNALNALIARPYE